MGPRRVLVVDDDIDAVITISHVLRQAGYETGMATDSQKALHLLREIPYGLVVTDLWMPDRTGLDLLAEIKRIRPDVRVVVMTAHGDWDTYQQALDAQALDYLQKPVRRDELLSLADNAFREVA